MYSYFHTEMSYNCHIQDMVPTRDIHRTFLFSKKESRKKYLKYVPNIYIGLLLLARPALALEYPKV